MAMSLNRILTGDFELDGERKGIEDGWLDDRSGVRVSEYHGDKLSHYSQPLFARGHTLLLLFLRTGKNLIY